MARPKSLKLRTLVTLHALYKYSDANHRMNTVKLNEFLRPYNVNCTTSRVLNDTVRVLRDFGIDVRNKGEWDNQGIWIENRPLPDHELNHLIFAVATNPHLSKQQTTEILQYLSPLVTVYQEPTLQGTIETAQEGTQDDMLYWVYSVIQEAISAKRRVSYAVDYVKYNNESRSVEKKRQWNTLFTPKCIYQEDGSLYMVGYNNTDKRVDAVNLKNITSIKLAFKHKDPKKEQVRQTIEKIVPRDYVPGKREEIVYKGPAVFRCRGQYVADLYNIFGEPDGPVQKDTRCRTTYAVKEAVITSETLHWFSQMPERGVRIKGPEVLREAVRNYYSQTATELLDTNIPANKRK